MTNLQNCILRQQMYAAQSHRPTHEKAQWAELRLCGPPSAVIADPSDLKLEHRVLLCMPEQCQQQDASVVYLTYILL